MPEVGELYVKITARMDELERQLKKVESDTPKRMNAMAEKSGQMMLRTFGEFSNKVGNVLSVGLTLPMAAFGKASFDASVKAESLDAALTGVVGSAERAAKQKEALRKMSDDLAVNYQALTKASLGVTAAFKGNLQESNYVLKNFSALGSALKISTADYERMNVNLTQISGSARLTGDELKEMASILPTMRPLLEKAFGTAESEKLAKMGISGKQALMAIAWEIEHGSLKPNLNTMSAKIAQFENLWTDFKVAAGDALIPLAKDLLPEVTSILKDVGDWLKKLSPDEKVGLAKWGIALAASGPIIKGLTGMLGLLREIRVTMQAIEGINIAKGIAAAGAGSAAGSGASGVLGFAGGPFGLIAAGAVTAYEVNKGALDDLLKTQDDNMKRAKQIGDDLKAHQARVDKAMLERFTEGLRATGSKEKAMNFAVTPLGRDAEWDYMRSMYPEDARKRLQGLIGNRVINVPKPESNPHGVKVGVASKGTGKDESDLTAELLMALGKAISTPKGAASCAFFASEVLRQTGVAVSKEGSAKSLIDAVKKQGGVEVKRSAAKAGDLVYYYGDGYGAIDHDPKKKGQQGYHVGIYKGDGTVVDSSGGVKRFNRGIGADARFVRPLRSGRYQNVGDVSMERAESVEAARKEAQRAAKEAAEESARQWKLYQDALTDSLRPIREFQWAKQAGKMQADGAMRYDVISTREFGKSFLDLSDDASKNRVRAIAMREVDTEEKSERKAMIGRNRDAWKELFEFADKKAGEKSANKNMSERNRDAWKNIFNRAGKESARMDQQALDRYSDAMSNLSEQHARLGGLTQVNQFRLRALAVEFGRGTTESERYANGLERAKQYMAEQLKLQNWQQWRELFDQVAQSLATPIRDALSDLVRLDFPDFFRNFGGLVDQALSDMANKIIDMQIKLQIQKGTDWAFGQIFGGGGSPGFDSGFQWSGSWDSASSPVLASASSSKLAGGPQVVQNLVINVGGSPSRETLQQVQVAAYQGMQEALRSNG